MATRLAIVLGSASDEGFFRGAIECLQEFQVEFVVKILSAHRSPDELREYIQRSDREGVELFIAGAGGAAHLAGAIAAHTIKPVIGVPLPSSALQGFDALLSTAQMPSGVPVATMAVGEWGAKNAALLAVQIFALNDATLKQRFQEYRQQMRQRVLAANKDRT